MFFQGLVVFLIVLGTGWILWKKVITPLMEQHGIEVDDDDEKEVKTDHTKRLEKTRKEFKQTKASAEAVKEEVDLRASMSKMEKEIKDADRTIEDGSFEEEDKKE